MVSSKATTQTASEAKNFSIKNLAKLYPYEQRWRDRQPWLLKNGYQLRPRFRPGWKPSWQKWEWLPSFIKYGLMNPFGREDSVPLMWGELIMDAVRLSDGKFVIMKIIDKRTHPDELNIANYLTSQKNERNHSVPVLDSFDAPDDSSRTIIVMPLLRKFDDLPFETVGEVIECVRQLLEGLQFMHEQGVAHRDCFTPNIMMDATHLYHIPFYPSKTDKRRDWKGPAKPASRTGKRVNYYLIDLGISKRYPAGSTPCEFPIIPADKSVPEHQGALVNTRSDPFATDVYLLGNAIRESFLRRPGSDKLQFMADLISHMTAETPAARPKIGEVVKAFTSLDVQGRAKTRLLAGGKGSTGRKQLPPPTQSMPPPVPKSLGKGSHVGQT